MKYLRKIVALLICVVFLAALVISLGIIFAVKNINIALITYAEDSSDSYADAKNSLSVFKGESILFLSEDEIKEAVKDSNYSLDSFEKKMPCTLNITLKERVETFAVFVGGYYSMYDNNGKYLRSAVENENINDGTPNVELKGIAIENIVKFTEIATTFKNTFNSLRSIVTEISLETKPEVEGYTDKLSFNLRCGLIVQLDDYSNDTQDKIAVAYAKFCTLTDRQKLNGIIRSYRIGGEDGVVNAEYFNL